MNLNGKVEVPKLALNTAFSFGTNASSPGGLLFGQNNQGQSGSAPFAFGNASASNPFAKPEVKAENKSPGFSEFGQNTPSSAFSFDQKPAEIARAPSSSGAFSFGQAPAAPVTTPSFAFGVAPINSNPFSQTASNAGSTPNSPSTFNQATPFAFASPTVPSNPFAFGSSQPASPANGNVSLPQASNTPGGGFAFGQTGGPAQSVSPFQASPPALPPVGGASLFTIGSAPPSAPPGGGRAIKKLPNRRVGKR
jgi:nucleoporin NUP1